MPGNNGGANWGGAAVDPSRGLLYVVSKDLPAMLRLEPTDKRKTPASGSPEQRGRAVFEAHCQSCHQADRSGKAGQVRSLADIGVRLERKQIENAIRQGMGPMPGFPKLPDSEVDSLIAYLYNPSRTASPALSSAPRATDSGPPRYYSGFNFMIASDGLSPIAPPWSSLTAYNLNEGTIQWKIPLGEVPELAAKGFKNTGSHYPKVGPVVTAGGVIFTGTRDRKVRALDAESGRTLWESPELDAALEGMPAVYELNGRQYIVFCASAQAGLIPATQGKIRGAYVAFALPE